VLDEADQVPPAFWQSAWLVIVESDEPLPDEPLPDEPRPDGLADGAVDDPEEEPDDGVDIEPLLEPEPVAPVLPELLDPVLPPVLLPPVLLPPPVCAAASAGTKQTIPIKTRVSIFFITPSSLCPGQRNSSLPTQGGQQYPGPRAACKSAYGCVFAAIVTSSRLD
jgi:hypothetical protein